MAHFQFEWKIFKKKYDPLSSITQGLAVAASSVYQITSGYIS